MTETKDKELSIYNSKLKSQIKQKTKNIEANIVGCLWKNPSLYLDYDFLDLNKFKNPIWKLYYSLGQKLIVKSIRVIEEVDVELLLDGKDNLKKTYDDFGGFDTISDLKDVCTVENIDSYVQDLIKWDVIWSIIERFSIGEDTIQKIETLDAEGVYNYYSALLNNTFSKTNNNVVVSKMGENIDQIIEDANKGVNKGLPFKSEILNNEVNGWGLGHTYLVAGLSGAGKTTWVQDVILPSIWELSESCVIILNEQDYDQWVQQFIVWIINNVIITDPNESFNSKRWLEGKFSNKEFGWLRQAQKMLEERKLQSNIITVEMKSYSQKEAERIIKQYANMGIEYFIIDTFKLSAERNDEAFWLSMQEDARKFDDLVKPSNLNVALMMTLQLQKGSRVLRYLTQDNIGLAKNVIDIASVALLMRRLFNDEMPSMKNELKVRKPIQGTNCFEEVVLNPNKKYVIIFIEKNRRGESQTYQIVAEQDLGLLVYKEVGICDIPVG